MTTRDDYVEKIKKLDSMTSGSLSLVDYNAASQELADYFYANAEMSEGDLEKEAKG